LYQGTAHRKAKGECGRQEFPQIQISNDPDPQEFPRCGLAEVASPRPSFSLFPFPRTARLDQIHLSANLVFRFKHSIQQTK
jgi:hypothetical protein